MKEYSKNNLGYTLIELLITIGIISLMSAAAAANFHLGQKKAILDDAANDLLVEIQRIQNIAISGIEVEDVIDFDPDEDTIVPCTYGIHYEDASTITITTEVPDAFGEPCAFLTIFNDDSSIKYNKNIDHSYDIFLGQNNNIGTFSFSTPAVEIGVPFDDIYFVPPDPDIYIDGTGLLVDSLPEDGRFDAANSESPHDVVEQILVCMRNETCAVGEQFTRVIEVSLGGRVELLR